MPLFGTFDTMQLEDVVQWVVNSNTSGTLTIIIDTEETYLSFDKGELVGISCGDSLRFDLGQLLLFKKILSEEQLLECHALAKGGKSLKGIIVEKGIVDQLTLEGVQNEYAFETVLDLFFQTEGNFHFSLEGPQVEIIGPEELEQSNILNGSIPTKSILMEAMVRLDEWGRIKEVFPSNYVVVSVTEKESDHPVWQELKSIGVPLSVGDLCLRMGSSRFSVYKSLFELHGKGLIALDEMNPGQANFSQLGSVEELVDSARVLIEEEQYEEAREVLSTAVNLEPENREARNILKRLRRAQLAYLYEQIPPHKTPVLAIDREKLKRMPLSSKESFLASRLNGKWDIGTLVVATPLGELDTLRVIRKLIHAQIVKLV